MRTLERTGSRNRVIYATLSGVRFEGTIFPAGDAQLPTITFLAPRHLLRTKVAEPIKAGDAFLDHVGRTMLIAEHDRRAHANTFTLFQMTHYVNWKRPGASTIHPVTKQQLPGSVQSLGMIWCAIESQSAIKDGGLNVDVDRERVITGAPIRLGDIVNDQVVKELTTALGVQIAEVQ